MIVNFGDWIIRDLYWGSCVCWERKRSLGCGLRLCLGFIWCGLLGVNWGLDTQEKVSQKVNKKSVGLLGPQDF